MKDLILVFIGGGLGSAVRLLINKIIPSDAFPYSTLTVNLVVLSYRLNYKLSCLL